MDKQRVGIHDSDRTGFPNLALMKLSAWHKQHGADVQWWMPVAEYDVVYSSKIFTFTPECDYLPEDTIKGGTGYGGAYADLPSEIDAAQPDYTMYPNCKHAIGFLTRGCIRHCPWCIVPKKEGEYKPYRDWHEVKRKDSRDVVFMDNNVLAGEYGIRQLESMIGQDIRIDFNQGLDARLIDDGIARILANLKWIRFIRMSCDTVPMLGEVLKAVDKLEKHGVKPYRVFVYLLVQDIDDAEYRAIQLRTRGVDVFAQPYRDFANKAQPTQKQRDFARWVNRKEIFKSTMLFQDYYVRRDNR